MAAGLRRTLVATALLLPVETRGADVIPVGPELQVSAPGDNIQLHEVGADAAGRFTAVWHGWIGGPVEGRLRRYDAAGAPLGAATTLLPGPLTPTGSGIAVGVAPSGESVVTWISDDVLAQRFDASGAPVGATFPVNTTLTGSRGSPDVAVHASGAFVVTWVASPLIFPIIDTEVVAQRFDAAGSPVGGEFQVNTTAAGEQQLPRVAALPGGGFVVVWTSGPSAEPYDYDVKAQVFDAAGAPVGGEIAVNAFTTEHQRDADVAVDAAGNFVVVWHSGGDQDGDGLGVFARRFTAAGVPLGAEFQVNTVTAGAQYRPHVAVDPAGGFFVVWDTERPGFGTITNNAAGRRYDATGMPLGPEFLVGAALRHAPDVAALGTDEWVVVGGAVDLTGRLLAQRFGQVAPVAGRKLLVKDHADPTRRRIVFRAVDASVSTQPGAAMDPVADGAYLHVYDADGGTDSACFALPAAGWTAQGNPLAPALKYRDPSSANGPCRVVALKHRKQLKAVCKADVAPIPYTLDEPSQGSVAVRLTSGTATYCAVFGPGSVLVDDGADRKFVAANAPAPAVCPTPPAACP